MGLAILITSQQLQLFSERKVLKEHEYATMLEADAALRTAQAEARRLQGEAEAAYEAERRRGYQEGWQQAQDAHARMLLAQAGQQHQAWMKLRRPMARLVVQAVTQMVAEADPARVFEQALRRVEPLLVDERFVQLRVARVDEVAVQEALAALREQPGWTLPVTLHVDPQQTPGQCVLQTAAGTMDLSLSAQIDALRRSLDPECVPQGNTRDD